MQEVSNFKSSLSRHDEPFLDESCSTAELPPCVVFRSGADALPEEKFFRGVEYVTARVAACLVFNGSGQGSTLRVPGLPAIPDHQRPVSAAVDCPMTRDDIDHDRIGLMGVSFAGYYTPRGGVRTPH